MALFFAAPMVQASLTLPRIQDCGSERRDVYGQLMPLVRTVPTLPKRAVREKIEGYVLLSFDVGIDGYATNIELVEAEPEGVFDVSAIEALKGTRFLPCRSNGELKGYESEIIRIEYLLSSGVDA